MKEPFTIYRGFNVRKELFTELGRFTYTVEHPTLGDKWCLTLTEAKAQIDKWCDVGKRTTAD